MFLGFEFKPIDTSNIVPLERFLAKARFLVGDKSFAKQGRNLIYCIYYRDDILGLVEYRLGVTQRLDGDSKSALLTKFALLGESEEEVETLLLLARREARRLGFGALYLNANEIPYEKEVGFSIAATHGIYLAKNPEKSVPTLRFLPLDGNEKPGIVSLR